MLSRRRVVMQAAHLSASAASPRRAQLWIALLKEMASGARPQLAASSKHLETPAVSPRLAWALIAAL